MKNIKTDHLSIFEHICTIPHGSGNIMKIAEFCRDFAIFHGCSAIIDGIGNVIIKCPASKGFEDRDTVILQGHTDMVCEKSLGSCHNFETDPLKLIYENGFLRAEGTTLGGDDGIAVAFALSIIANKELKHPPLEVLLTADEETGLYGAEALDGKLLNGRKMINIDSEEEGILLAGCAGGLTAKYNFEAKTKTIESRFITLNLDGLAGGHSGAEIHKKRLNGIKALNLICKELINLGCNIAEFRCGTKMNAIPFGGYAVLSVEQDKMDVIIENINFYFDKIKALCISADDKPNLNFEFSETINKTVLSHEDSKRLVSFIDELPDGIISFVDESENLVETSLNLGVLDFTDGKFNAIGLIRSSVNSDLDAVADDVSRIAEKYGFSVEFYDRYPAWEFKGKSELRDKMCLIYKEMFGKELKVDVIHAGLECGILSDKMPGLDCVSIGPNIFDIHTYQERLDLASCERTYNFLLKVLEEI